MYSTVSVLGSVANRHGDEPLTDLGAGDIWMATTTEVWLYLHWLEVAATLIVLVGDFRCLHWLAWYWASRFWGLYGHHVGRNDYVGRSELS